MTAVMRGKGPGISRVSDGMKSPGQSVPSCSGVKAGIDVSHLLEHRHLIRCANVVKVVVRVLGFDRDDPRVVRVWKIIVGNRFFQTPYACIG